MRIPSITSVTARSPTPDDDVHSSPYLSNKFRGSGRGHSNGRVYVPVGTDVIVDATYAFCGG